MKTPFPFTLAAMFFAVTVVALLVSLSRFEWHLPVSLLVGGMAGACFGRRSFRMTMLAGACGAALIGLVDLVAHALSPTPPEYQPTPWSDFVIGYVICVMPVSLAIGAFAGVVVWWIKLASEQRTRS